MCPAKRQDKESEEKMKLIIQTKDILGTFVIRLNEMDVNKAPELRLTLRQPESLNHARAEGLGSMSFLPISQRVLTHPSFRAHLPTPSLAPAFPFAAQLWKLSPAASVSRAGRRSPELLQTL